MLSKIMSFRQCITVSCLFNYHTIPVCYTCYTVLFSDIYRNIVTSTGIPIIVIITNNNIAYAILAVCLIYPSCCFCYFYFPFHLLFLFFDTFGIHYTRRDKAATNIYQSSLDDYAAHLYSSLYISIPHSRDKTFFFIIFKRGHT